MILYPEKPERISKILSACSVCSRREAERLIAEGRIALNGVTVVEQGARAVLATDAISLDGSVLDLKSGGGTGFRYYLLNKPRGFLTTCSDPFGRRTIFDLIRLDGHYYPAGRLDMDSRGLVLITNDGLLCGLVTHPRNMVVKKYRVTVSRELAAAEISAVKSGVEFEGEIYRALEAALIEKKNGGRAVYEIKLNEGKKREIRQMIKALGARVIDLFRTAIANLTVDGIPEGKYREITGAELIELKKITGYGSGQELKCSKK